MKLAPYSDLHLEMYYLNGRRTAEKVWSPVVFDYDKEETILCLGGDLWYGPRVFEWIRDNELNEKFKAIVMIMGNHDYWYHDFNTIHDVMAEGAAEFDNVHFLHNATKIIERIRFIGGPLWTDFDKEDPLNMVRASAYMNDYAYMYKEDEFGNHRRIRPVDILTEHHKTVAALKDVFEDFDGKTVVMTHHLPSWNLISGHYRLNSPRHINSYYAANCDHLIETGKYDVWMYGHTHDSLILKDDDSMIVCNPKGYHKENSHFIHDLRIDL